MECEYRHEIAKFELFDKPQLQLYVWPRRVSFYLTYVHLSQLNQHNSIISYNHIFFFYYFFENNSDGDPTEIQLPLTKKA